MTLVNQMNFVTEFGKVHDVVIQYPRKYLHFPPTVEGPYMGQ